MAFGSPSFTISYNGFTFDERTETLAFSARPKYDASGRTVAYVVYSITLKTIITSSSATCDTEMLNARRRLLKPGQAFQYTSAGAGGLSINVNPATVDVAWGPKPQELSYKPIGVKAAEIVWKVDVAIPECATAVFKNALMEFNYRLSIEIDRDGWSTRTYRGYYVIPMTRNLDGSRKLTTSADAFWDSIVPDVPNGFRREINTRELDESKSRIEFTIVDSEMGPNILPPGVTECRASHTLESSDRGFASWNGAITAEYTCARDFSPEQTFIHFYGLVIERTDWMKTKGVQLGGNSNVGPEIKGVVLPTKFSMSEPDIFGKPTARYQLQFLYYQNFKDILASSGLWLPVETNSDWKTWKTSLEKTALHPRGNAKLGFNPSDDVIIDLCLGARDAEISTSQDLKDANRKLKGADFAGQCPKPEDSWIYYDIHLEGESADQVLVHKPMPTQGVVQTLDGLVPTIISPPDIVQRRATNQDVVFVTGSALRVCFDIPIPRLQSIGGQEVIQANRQDDEYFKTGVLGNYGHTVFWATWRLRYIVPAKPNRGALYNSNLQAVGTPTNPRESGGGVGSIGTTLFRQAQ